MAQLLAVAYVASVPFDVLPVALPFGARSLPFLVGITFLAVALVELLQRDHRFVFPDRLVILALLALVIFAIASYFWAVDPARAAGRVPTVLVLTLTTVLLAGYLPAVWLPALWAYSACSGLLGVLVLLAPAGQYEYRRTASGNEDDVGALLVLASVIALHLALSSTANRAVLATGLLIVCATGAVATGSRGAVIAGSIGLVVTLLQSLSRRRRDVVRLAALMIVAAVAVLAMPRQFVPPRVAAIDDAILNRQFSGRDDIWARILDRGLDPHGIGLGGTQHFMGTITGRAHVAHNSVLGILLELGLIGLFLFGLVVTVAVFLGRRSAFRTVLLPLGLTAGILSLALTLEWRRCLWLVLAFALTPAMPSFTAGTGQTTSAPAGSAPFRTTTGGPG